MKKQFLSILLVAMVVLIFVPSANVNAGTNTISINVQDVYKMYDGTALTPSSVQVLRGYTDVTDDAILTYATSTDKSTWSEYSTNAPSITDAGILYFKVKAVIDSVSKESDAHTLTVEKRNVTVVTGSAISVYSACPAIGLTNAECTIIGDGFVDGEMEAGYPKATGVLAKPNVEPASLITVDNTIEFSWSGNGKASNYEIYECPGKLGIAQEEASAVIASNYSGDYDGVGHNTAFATTLVEPYTVQYRVDGLDVPTIADPTIFLKDVGNHSVSVTVTKGGLTAACAYNVTIYPRKISLKSDSSTKEYDGTPLTANGVSVVGGSYASGEEFDYGTLGSITNPGSVDNAFGCIENASTKICNYDIKFYNGTLTVTGIMDETTLQNAINSAESGDVLKILDDITLTKTLQVSGDKAITLDLNGKEISSTGLSYAITIASSAKLTIDDTSDNKEGCISTECINTLLSHYTIWCKSDSSLIVKDANIKTKYEHETKGGKAYCIYVQGKLTIEDGANLEAYSSGDKNSVYAIYISSGEGIINGGNIKVDGKYYCTCVHVFGGTLVINGGSCEAINASGDLYVSPVYIFKGKSDSATLVINKPMNIDTTACNGTIFDYKVVSISSNVDISNVVANEGELGNIKIPYGNYVSGDMSKFDATKSEITGGNFTSSNVKDFLSGDYVVVKGTESGYPYKVIARTDAYEVTFNTSGLSDAIDNQYIEKVAAEKFVTEPVAPSHATYTFDGWYDQSGDKWNFANEVSGDVQLTAKWKNNGKTVVTTQLDFKTAGDADNLSEYGYKWDSASKILTLNNVTIDCSGTFSEEHNIAIDLPAESTINLTNDNIAIAGETSGDGKYSIAICARGDLTISGDGNLLAIGGKSKFVSAGIQSASSGSLMVKGNVSITSKAGNATFYSSGINISQNLTIEKDATVNAYGANATIEYYGIWMGGCANIAGTLNLYGACKTGTSTKEAMYLESDADVLTIADKTGKITSDGIIKTNNTNAFGLGNNTDKLYAVINGDVKVLNGVKTVTPKTNKRMQIFFGKYKVNVNGTEIETCGYLNSGDAIFNAPTKSGYKFIGWFTDATCKNVWNFENDVVTEDVSLYPGFVDENNEIIETIAGTILDADSLIKISDATVELYQGNKKIEATLSDENGNFTFSKVVPGVYNIVIKNDDYNATIFYVAPDYNNMLISLATNKTIVEANETGAVIDGLSQISGSEVKLKLEDIAKNSEDIAQQSIRALNTSKYLYYIDAELTSEELNITDASGVITMVFPYKANRRNIVAYRYHSGEAVELTKETSKMATPVDGHYYVDTENKLIYIYASKFSTYAIGYSIDGSGSASNVETEYEISIAKVKNGTVEVSVETAEKGDKITITVDPDKGYTLETLLVEDDNGKEVTTTGSDNKYTFKMPSSDVEISATFMEDNTMLNYFVDVNASAYYYDAVLWAADNGITSGIDNLHFGPDAVTNRAQMVTFLWRMAGSPEPTTSTSKFTDVEEGSYYEKAVLWAVENKITEGTSETTFSPDMSLKRAHTVTFLYRFAGSKNADTENKFIDVKTDAYYYNAVLWAVANGITSGTSETTFAPDTDCTRCQIVTFLYRYSQK